MSKREYPEWMDEPLEYWDEQSLHLFLNHDEMPKRKPRVYVDELIDFIKARSPNSDTVRHLEFWLEEKLKDGAI